jgi:hypothetical protein
LESGQPLSAAQPDVDKLPDPDGKILLHWDDITWILDNSTYFDETFPADPILRDYTLVAHYSAAGLVKFMDGDRALKVWVIKDGYGNPVPSAEGVEGAVEVEEVKYLKANLNLGIPATVIDSSVNEVAKPTETFNDTTNVRYVTGWMLNDSSALVLDKNFANKTTATNVVVNKDKMTFYVRRVVRVAFYNDNKYVQPPEAAPQETAGKGYYVVGAKVSEIDVPSLTASGTHANDQFIGWGLGNTKEAFDFKSSETIAAPMVFNALWGKTVTFMTGRTSDDILMKYNAVLKTPFTELKRPGIVPEKEGFNFKGWGLNNEKIENLVDFETTDKIVTDNIRFYAIYSKTYTISFYDGGEEPIEKPQEKEIGSLISDIKVPQPDDATFVGWALAGTVEVYDFKAHAEEEITEDMDFEALHKYSITFLDEDGTELKSKSAYPWTTLAEINEEAPEKEYKEFLGWFEKNGELIAEEPTVFDDTLVDGSKTFIAKYDYVKALPTLEGIGMDLQGKIQMRVRFSLPDELKDAGYSVKLGDKATIPFSEKEYDTSTDSYIFKCFVLVPEYDEEIEISILDAEGKDVPFRYKTEEDPYDSFIYSLETYIENMKKKAEGDQLALVNALEVYCKAAKHVFLGGEAIAVTADMSSVKDTVKPDELPAGITKITRSVSTEEDNTMRFRIYLETAGTEGNYNFTLPAGAVKTVEGKVVTIAVRNIAAPNLDIRYTVSVSDGTVTATTEASPLSYLKGVIGKYTDGTDELACALKNYCDAAKKFFAAKGK